MWAGVHCHAGANAGTKNRSGHAESAFPRVGPWNFTERFIHHSGESWHCFGSRAFEHHELSELPLPAILHYGASHYVVLAYRKGQQVCVMNPAIGQQWLPFASLKTEISGYALILDPQTRVNAEQSAETGTTKSTLPHAMSLKETAAVPGMYGLMLITFLVSLTLFLMPSMVSNAINQAFAEVGNSRFPYGWFIAAFIASTLLALGVRVISERFIKRFVLLNSSVGFSRLLANPLRFLKNAHRATSLADLSLGKAGCCRKSSWITVCEVTGLSALSRWALCFGLLPCWR